MADQRSIRFAKPALLRQFLNGLVKARVPFSVTADGTITYPKQFDERVEAEVLSPLRSQVFSRWQLLSFPKEWATVYAAYMRGKKIPFVPEWSNGRLTYLLPASYRPHTWTLPDPTEASTSPSSTLAAV